MEATRGWRGMMRLYYPEGSGLTASRVLRPSLAQRSAAPRLGDVEHTIAPVRSAIVSRKVPATSSPALHRPWPPIRHCNPGRTVEPVRRTLSTTPMVW